MIDWGPVRRAVDNFVGYQGSPFGVLIGNASGLLFSYSRGAYNFSAPIAVASASKWISAMAIAYEIERGAGGLTWDSKPQQFIPNYPSSPLDARSNITLLQLLGFISGLGEVPCTDGIDGDPSSLNFWPCIANLTVSNNPLRYGTPGRNFSYGGQHLHMAGAMAASSLAGGTASSTWGAVWQQLRAALGLPSTCCVYTPLVNPLVAGGLVTSPLTYASILTKYLPGGILTSATITRLEIDQTPADDVNIAKSPMLDYGFDWHYASGHWVECRVNQTCLAGDPGCSSLPVTRWQPHCSAGCEHSSPGAFGFYPHINRCFSIGTSGYWGIVAIPNGTGLMSALLGNTLWPAVRASFASQFQQPSPPTPSASVSASTTAAAATGSSTSSVSSSLTATCTPSRDSSSALPVTLSPSGTISDTMSLTVSGSATLSASASLTSSVSHTLSATSAAAASATATASASNATDLRGGSTGNSGPAAGNTAAAVISALVFVSTLVAGTVMLYKHRQSKRQGVLSSSGLSDSSTPTAKPAAQNHQHPPRSSVAGVVRGSGGHPAVLSSRPSAGPASVVQFTNPASRGSTGR